VTRKCDLLIVGAGLAGSMLAWRLRQAGCDAMLISDPIIPSASRAAAGLINPVTGQRLVLQENIEALLESAHAFYHEIESRFGITILHQRQMLRLFRNDKERSAWEKRKANPKYRPYLDDRLQSTDGFIQHKTGYLDTNMLLDTLYGAFRSSDALIESSFDYADLDIDKDSVRWRNLEAKRIVFCEGWRGQSNPWFAYLPFQPAKGEILTLESSHLPERIINRGKWLLPTGKNRCKLGATYGWNNLNEVPSDAARDELLAALPLLDDSSGEAKVINHVAGIRPGTLDKHPFIGFHPRQPGLAIFNGFGSKGSLLIPWYAEQFAKHLLAEKPLPSEADIARFNG